MLAKVLSGAVMGIDAFPVEVEVDITSGLPTFTTVGLPEAAVKESKERVKSAVNNSGYRFPADRITVNLAPADIKKEGTGFDLPIALGILGDVKWDWLPALLLGSLLGGYAGAHLAILKGNVWIKRAFETVTLLVGLKLIVG